MSKFHLALLISLKTSTFTILALQEGVSSTLFTVLNASYIEYNLLFLIWASGKSSGQPKSGKGKMEAQELLLSSTYFLVLIRDERERREYIYSLL